MASGSKGDLGGCSCEGRLGPVPSLPEQGYASRGLLGLLGSKAQGTK